MSRTIDRPVQDNQQTDPPKAYTAPTLDKRVKLADVSESGPVVISGILINGF